MKKFISILLTVAMLFSISACKNNDVSKVDKQGEEIQRNSVVLKTSEGGINDYNEFAFNFFKQTVASEEEGKNILVSPLSVALAFAMAENATSGETLAEIKKVFHNNIPQEEYNAFMGYIKENLGENIKAANSIWMRDSFAGKIKQEFLQTNKDYFNAEIYTASFDDKAVDAINNWVSENTDAMITKLLERIDPSTIMYLINAISFEAEWETPFQKVDVTSGDFTAYDGSVKQVDFMTSIYPIRYIRGDYDFPVHGFVKPYKNKKYSFVALTLNSKMFELCDSTEDVIKVTTIYDCIERMNQEQINKLMQSACDSTIFVKLPKFTLEYSASLNEILKGMGINLAFDENRADFSAMSDEDRIHISDVAHKTFMQVDEAGTKASAVTSITVDRESALLTEAELLFDKPFVCMIIDNENNMPVFTGAVMDLGEEAVICDKETPSYIETPALTNKPVVVETPDVTATPDYVQDAIPGKVTVTVKRVSDDKEHILRPEDALAVLKVLEGLEYKENEVCKCMCEYMLFAEGTAHMDREKRMYGVNLTEKYARYYDGETVKQARLTSSQAKILLERCVTADIS